MVEQRHKKKHKCRSMWMINWSDNILLAFRKEVAGMTMAVQSHCETLWSASMYDGDNYVLRHLFVFLLKICHLFRETTVRSVEWPSLILHVLTCFFEVSVSVRQVTVNEMKTKQNTWMHIVNVTVKNTSFNNWSSSHPHRSHKTCSDVQIQCTNKWHKSHKKTRVESRDAVLNHDLTPRSDSV